MQQNNNRRRLGVADELVAGGYRDAGYRYVCIGERGRPDVLYTSYMYCDAAPTAAAAFTSSRKPLHAAAAAAATAAGLTSFSL